MDICGPILDFWNINSLANKYSKHIEVQLLSSATSILLNEQRSYESYILIKVRQQIQLILGADSTRNLGHI